VGKIENRIIKKGGGVDIEQWYVTGGSGSPRFPEEEPDDGEVISRVAFDFCLLIRKMGN
jgi:hypothetical protein